MSAPWEQDEIVSDKPWEADASVAPTRADLSFVDKALNIIGRGAWALPGLVGLDYEKAQSIATGAPESKFNAESAQVDRENPVLSGVGRGVSAAPAEALLWMTGTKPAAALAPVFGAASRLGPFLQKFFTFGPRMGAITAASEYGSTGYKDPVDRALGATAAGVTGTAVGGTMAGALPNPMALVPSHPTFDPAASEAALARAEGNATAASRSASRSLSAATGGDAGAANDTTVVIRPSVVDRVVPAGFKAPEPTPQAQYLLDRGVPLTRGQYDSTSPAAATEIASQSLEHSGAGIRAQRHAALNQATDLAFNVARPPKTEPIPLSGDINAKFAVLDDAWDNAYEGVKAQIGDLSPRIVENPTVRMTRQSEAAERAVAQVARVDDALRNLEAQVAHEQSRLKGAVILDPQAAARQNDTLRGLASQRIDLLQQREAVQRAAKVAMSEDKTVSLAQAMEQAVNDPRLMAGEEATRIVSRFVNDQLSRLRGADGDVPAGALLDLRKEIRRQAREMLRNRRGEEHELLRAAERQISEVIYSQADPAAVARLKELDANYHNYKIVEEAVIRAGDAPGGFSPATLSASLRSAEANRNDYALGGGGEMRDLTKAIRSVFDESISPATGSRLLTVGPQWWREALGQTIYLRNRSAVNATGGRAASEATAAAKAAARARQAVTAQAPVSESGFAEFLGRGALPRYPSQEPGTLPVSQMSLEALAEFLRSRGLGVRVPVGAAGEEE